jgi:hypothetical protein
MPFLHNQLTTLSLSAASGSHQSVLNGAYTWAMCRLVTFYFAPNLLFRLGLLTEHASSTGLRIKVFQRDSNLGEAFPGGYHYHKRKNYMKNVIQGKRSPYIFHMSWTTNKENKKLYYEQLGDWFVNEECVSKPLGKILIRDDANLSAQCCLAEPRIVCHYRDKPSKVPCKDSLSIDKDALSFW